MKCIIVCLLILLGLPLAAWAEDRSARADRSAVVRGNTRFALDLYARLRGHEGNLFFSPYSISTALAMTSAGARGQTAAQMAAALHLPLSDPGVHPALGAVIQEINAGGKERGYTLRTANALWGQQGYPFRPAFVQLLREDYQAGLREVDFARTEEARQTINAWAERETQDKIRDLLARGVLAPNTRLVLTNAIYFKGNWKSPFQKSQTRPGPFSRTDGTPTDVPLMHQTERFGYFAEENLQGLELPYIGADLTMVVLLPGKPDGLADLEKALTADRLARWLRNLHPAEVRVTLPRFQVTAGFQLNRVLEEMGMRLAFGRQADFSGIAGGEEPLYLSAVVHKAFVDVNEQGTEAAAATAVGVKAAALRREIVFQADHPFVFLIRDRRSDSILFLGRVADPK